MHERLIPNPTRPRTRRHDHQLRRAARDVGRGRIERALRGYLGIAAEAPGDLQQLNRTGDLMVRARQVERGVALFLEVAQGYERDGFEAKALAVYRKILRITPGNGEAARRVRALESNRDPTQALCS